MANRDGYDDKGYKWCGGTPSMCYHCPDDGDCEFVAEVIREGQRRGEE